MNFYPFHIGDFFIATAHLSWDEGHAYRLLLDLYYKEEAPLPADTAQIARLLRISNKSHLRAIDSVLREFFTLTDAGWVNRRCDAEIAKADERREAAAARANARWHKDGTIDSPRGARCGHAKGKPRRSAEELNGPPLPAAEDAAASRGSNASLMHTQCPNDAAALLEDCASNAGGMPAQCTSNAAAMLQQCLRNAPNTNTNTNTNPNPNTNPKRASSAAGEAHDHAPARSAFARVPGDAAAVAGRGVGRGEDGENSTAANPSAMPLQAPVPAVQSPVLQTAMLPAPPLAMPHATPLANAGGEPGPASRAAPPATANHAPLSAFASEAPPSAQTNDAMPIAQPIPDPPASLADWHNFFTRAGFAPRHLANQNTRAAMLDWVRLRVTQAHMHDVMARARTRRDSPTSPAYFVPMIRDDFNAARSSGAPPFIALPGVAAIAGIGAGADAPRRPSIEPI